MRNPWQRHFRSGPMALIPIAIPLFLFLVLTSAGCLIPAPNNMDWTTPAGDGAGGGGDRLQAIQQVLDTYSSALVTKDEGRFLSTIDAGNPGFFTGQQQKFDRLAEVPFSQYQIKAIDGNEKTADNVIAKVETSFTLQDSFTDLPDPERSAVLLVRREDGWKITGDTSEQSLGRPRNAGLEDFGHVYVLATNRTIVFYLAGQNQTAGRVAQLIENGFSRLGAVMPQAQLPKVPVRVFDNKDQIDKAFPGKWTEWTGGAARQLGEQPGQGGEIVIDAQSFSSTNGYDPGYNPKMLAHELTHVATFQISDERTPPFLLEGLADYVAGETDISDIRQKVISGENFSPTLRDLYQPSGFTALLNSDTARLAYEQSDAAVALLIEKYGSEKVLRLIKEFKQFEDEKDQNVLVDRAFREVLGIGWNDFETEWRDYVLRS